MECKKKLVNIVLQIRMKKSKSLKDVASEIVPSLLLEGGVDRRRETLYRRKRNSNDFCIRHLKRSKNKPVVICVNQNAIWYT